MHNIWNTLVPLNAFPIHGEFTSADASALTEANSRITLYKRDRSAYTLVAGDVLVLTDLAIVTNVALTVSIYDGADNTVAVSERAFLGNMGVNGVMVHSFVTPFIGSNAGIANGHLKVKTSGAGQVDVNITGFIIPVYVVP